MKNSFGNQICVTLFGESHGEYIGATIDGVAAGIKIDEENIKLRLGQRRPQGYISTSRVEADEYIFASGAYRGYTTGSPLTILIKNECANSSDYSEFVTRPRPSHADYVAGVKYNGYQDPRGGGHFSGRITAPLVAVGAILESALRDKGIYIGTHISRIQEIEDSHFSDFLENIKALNLTQFPTLNEEMGKRMIERITHARDNSDSVGGVLESAVVGMPVGVGEPWFDSVESMLSHVLFSIPGIKGVEFGLGFGFADCYGSQANDSFLFNSERVITKTNNNGGINGGITNGMPIIFRCAVRPTPSIFREQKTVNLESGENTTLQIKGRHDPAIIHRIRAVVDAVTAITLADLLVTKYGTYFLLGGEK